MSVESISYGRYGLCARLCNQALEVRVTQDMGPRIIWLSLLGQPNQFVELPPPSGDAWDMLGGHRLWHAPEVKERTYELDNQPVQVTPTSDGQGLVAVQPVEALTGIEKSLEVRLPVSPRAYVEVLHRLTNRGVWPVTLSAWALTALPPGGTAIVPQPHPGGHAQNLAPIRSMAIWAYTDMADARWSWGRDVILLRQGPGHSQKIGVHNEAGWLAWHRLGHLFVKRFDYQPGVRYPDFDSTVELYTNGEFLELETLGPLVLLEPGATVTHRESWFLYADVPPLEDSILTTLDPYLQDSRPR